MMKDTQFFDFHHTFLTLDAGNAPLSPGILSQCPKGDSPGSPLLFLLTSKPNLCTFYPDFLSQRAGISAIPALFSITKNA